MKSHIWHYHLRSPHVISFVDHPKNCVEQISSLSDVAWSVVDMSFCNVVIDFGWASFIIENKMVQKHVSMTILETKRVIFITKQFVFWLFTCLFVPSGGKFCVFILFARVPLKINMVRMKLMLLSMHLTLLKMFFGVYIVI